VSCAADVDKMPAIPEHARETIKRGFMFAFNPIPERLIPISADQAITLRAYRAASTREDREEIASMPSFPTYDFFLLA
jgi:hypothetical protein